MKDRVSPDYNTNTYLCLHQFINKLIIFMQQTLHDANLNLKPN